MKFFIAIVSALLAIALAAPAPEAEAEADAEAKNVNVRFSKKIFKNICQRVFNKPSQLNVVL